MTLVWKLLRQHVSIPQLSGFFFANLFGMLIVLLGHQLYNDVMPVFTSEDSFMKPDYLIVSKKIGTGNTISGRANNFSDTEIEALQAQGFVTKLGAITSTDYKVDVRMGVNKVNVLNSELFFESMPNEFVRVDTALWAYTEGSQAVPLILPRTYLTMYNLGIARSHSLPQLSEDLAGMIDLDIFIQGNGHQDSYKGRVIGFSNRLSTILVPQAFMDWSNGRYAANRQNNPTRLVMQVDNPADQKVTSYFNRKGYDIENGKLEAERATYFLRMMVVIVMAVGIVISLLSFYILMLSIYLLVQKNTSKLENLLLIGYSPSRVARPYQLLAVGLNVLVLVFALCILLVVRQYYMAIVGSLLPGMATTTVLPAVCLGCVLLLLVSCCNVFAIRHKIMTIWNHKD